MQSHWAQVRVLEKLAENVWSCELASVPPETAKESCRNLFFKYCKHPLFLRSVTNTSQVCLTSADYTASPFAFPLRGMLLPGASWLLGSWALPCILLFWPPGHWPTCARREPLAGNAGGPGLQPSPRFVECLCPQHPCGPSEVDFGWQTGNIASMWNRMKREPSAENQTSIKLGGKQNAGD